MPQRRLVVMAVVGAALLSGCASMRGGRETASQPSIDQVIATLPPEQRAPITEAESRAREVERRAEQAEEAVRLAEQRVAAAEAEVEAQKAAVEKAKAEVELVRRQTQAQLEGVPVSGQVPAEAQAARRRLEDAQYAVDVAQWQQQRAESLLKLRRAEQAYAQAFARAAREEVAVRQAEADVVRAQVAARAVPGAVPGVVDPRVAQAEAKLREVQARFSRARAEAVQRLADVQLQRRAMARFESGPPPRLAAAQGGGQSGGQPGLVSQPREVEAEPLPWPSAWEPGRTGQSGEGTSQDQGSRPMAPQQ